MTDERKIEEGLALIRQAEKSLKTSIFKWRPDYSGAADDYMKAATAFRNAGTPDQSQDCLLKACESYKNNGSWFHAAKCYEQIIVLIKENDVPLKIEEFANKASDLYQQHGSAEAAAAALEKSAKIIEKNNPEVALRLYQRALEIVMIEDSPRRAAEYISKISRILVKLKMYNEAADSLRREIGFNQETESHDIIGRLAVALVLVQLGRDDFVAAEKAFKEWGNYCNPEEMQTLEVLLQAIDYEDHIAINKALLSPFIRHMDVEYSILARDIQNKYSLKELSEAGSSVGDVKLKQEDASFTEEFTSNEQGSLC